MEKVKAIIENICDEGYGVSEKWKKDLRGEMGSETGGVLRADKGVIESGVVIEGEKRGGVGSIHGLGVDNKFMLGVEFEKNGNRAGIISDDFVAVQDNVLVLVEALDILEGGDGGGKKCGGGGGGEHKTLSGGVTELKSLNKVEGQQDIKKNDEENGGKGTENDEYDGLQDQSHEFHVGDFVWGKVKSYPWWPGQIYDASDASVFAEKLKQKDRFLVAYFGDGSFSWCSKSQLKPFIENYKDMAEQSNSKSFVFAVETCLDEVSRIMELDMTCLCVAEDDKREAGMASNSGIKEGVLVPVKGVAKSFTDQCEPKDLIAKLRNFAKTVSVNNMFDLTVSKSWLTAYYRAKGGYRLPSYHYPVVIQGFQDKSNNPMEVPVQGPDGERWFSAPVVAHGSGFNQSNQPFLQKCSDTTTNILYQRRNQKGATELIEDERRKERSVVKMATDIVVADGNSVSVFVQAIETMEDEDGCDKKCGGKDDEHRALSGECTELKSSNNVEEDGDGENNDKENVAEGTENSKDDDLVDQNHEFHVGDFVWGKITSYPWWPGQIYDASDASDVAEKLKQNDRFLVAYFGDGSFSWCSRSQLKCFIENFKDMSKQSNSKSFVYAVETCLDEVRRIVELDMTCSCATEYDKHEAGMASNSGIKEGVRIPVKGVAKSFTDQCEPKDLIVKLRNFAKTVSVNNMFDLTVSKSWLTAYYRAKGGYRLPSYHYPVLIQGLEDKSNNSMEVPVKGPNGEQWFSAPAAAVGSGFNQSNQPFWQKCQETATDNLYQRKKQNCVAEPIEYVIRKGESVVNESNSVELTSGKRKREDNNEADKQDNTLIASQLGLVRGKKKKAVPSGSPRTVGITSKNGELADCRGKEADDAPLSTQTKMRKLAGAEDEDEEEAIRSKSSRGRKRSKYLSPPFTNSIPKMKTSRLSIDCGKKSEKNSRARKRITKAAEDLELTAAKKAANASDKRMDNESVEKNAAPMALLLTYPQAYSLPSKDELMKIYSKFGAVNEKETDVFYSFHCARVSYLRSSDADAAYKASVDENPFGTADVYMIQHPSAAAKLSDSSQKLSLDNATKSLASNDEAAYVGLIREKLKTMSSMLESLDGRVSAEMKSNLEGDVKGLLEKVNLMTVAST